MDEMSDLIARAHEGEEKAREILIEKNLGLVHHIVKRFYGRGVEAEDLFQIGVIGLIKAIDRFDLSLGLKFSTYAVPMISGEIKRFLRDDGPVKISRTIREHAFKVKAAVQKLESSLNREPTIKDIAGLTGLSEEEIVIAMEADTRVESLYSAVTQEDGNEMYLVDRIVMDEENHMGSRVSKTSDYEKEKLIDRMLLNDLLGQLDSQERKLIWLRYFQNQTQTEIAVQMGISQVQVSRLEKKILTRMRSKI